MTCLMGLFAQVGTKTTVVAIFLVSVAYLFLCVQSMQSGDTTIVSFFNVDAPACTLGIALPSEYLQPSNDPDNGPHSYGVSYVNFCLALQLQPDDPIYYEVKEGREVLQIIYPWDNHPNNYPNPEPPECYDEYESYDDNPDRFAWYTHTNAMVFLSLEEQVQQETHIIPSFGFSGQTFAGAQEKALDEFCPDEPKCEPVAVNSPLSTNRKRDCKSDWTTETGVDGECDVSEEGGEANISSDNDSSSGDDEDKPLYATDTQNNVYFYLRSGTIPPCYRGKFKFKARKAFMQNARRRYRLEKTEELDNDGEPKDVLLSISGTGSTKRRRDRSVPSHIRSKLFNTRIVPKAKHIMRIILEDHDHFGHNKAEYRLSTKYRIHGLRELVQSVSGNNCPVCAKFQPIPKIPTRPIVTSRRNQLVMFDLTQFYVPNEEGVQWFLTVVDHFTKFIWGRAFATKEAEPIAEYLAELFGEQCGLPERWHADNGGEFKNAHMEAARKLLSRNAHNPDLEKNLLRYSHGMPRNPRCQGLVERGNRTIKECVLKQMEEDGYDRAKHTTWEWVEMVRRKLKALNQSLIKPYGVSPWIMMHGSAPSAPDHCQLSAADQTRLHTHAYRAQCRMAKTGETTCTLQTYEPGTHVLIYALKDRRSHNDLSGRGSMSWPSSALVVAESRTTKNWYEIQWTSKGIGGENAGTVASRQYPSWMLKRVMNPAGIHMPDFHAETPNDTMRKQTGTESNRPPKQTKTPPDEGDAEDDKRGAAQLLSDVAR